MFSALSVVISSNILNVLNDLNLLNGLSGCHRQFVRPFAQSPSTIFCNHHRVAPLADIFAVGGNRRWLANEYGVRADQQEITETFRIGLLRRTGLDPLRGGHTVVRAGVGVFYDRVPLNVYGFASYPDQSACSMRL